MWHSVVMGVAGDLASSNTTTNKYNDSTVCHPLLLAQGNKSEVGLCDDMTSALVISAIVLFIHTALIVVSIGGLIYKLRKLNTLKKEHKNVVNYLQVARNPPLMIMGALIGWTYTFVLMTRVLIGRKIYPCFIFSLIYYLAVPALSNTVILRCIRLLVLTKLNELKVRIGNRQYDLHATTSSENMKHMLEANSSLNLSNFTNENEMQELRTSEPSGSLSNLSSVSVEIRNSVSVLAVGRTPGILSQFTIEPKENTYEKEIEDEMIFRKETLLELFERGKLLSMLRFLVSSKFIYMYYGLLMIMHLVIFFIIAVVDYFSYYSQNQIDSNQKRNSFTIDSYLLSPSGCGVGSYNQYVFISYLAFYGAVGILFSIIAFVAKRDVWNVKIEIIIINLAWVLVIIIYGIPSLFTIITTYVDYYFPWTITILIGCMWDTLISFTYPVFGLQRFKSEKSTQNNGEQPTQSVNQDIKQTSNASQSNITKILTNEKWNKLFLNFSEKCFACEDIMMWNAVEKFRSISSEKQRRELFYNICNTYIRVGAPLELNIPRREHGIPEIEQIFKSLKESNINFASRNGQESPSFSKTTSKTGSPKKGRTPNNTTGMDFIFSVTPEIFDRIQGFCEHNMLDNYQRFQYAYEKQLEKELDICTKSKLV